PAARPLRFAPERPRPPARRSRDSGPQDRAGARCASGARRARARPTPPPPPPPARASATIALARWPRRLRIGLRIALGRGDAGDVGPDRRRVAALPTRCHRVVATELHADVRQQRRARQQNVRPLGDERELRLTQVAEPDREGIDAVRGAILVLVLDRLGVGGPAGLPAALAPGGRAQAEPQRVCTPRTGAIEAAERVVTMSARERVADVGEREGAALLPLPPALRPTRLG